MRKFSTANDNGGGNAATHLAATHRHTRSHSNRNAPATPRQRKTTVVFSRPVPNQDGIATWFGYDGAGRLIAVTNALGQVTRYQYDEAGNEILQVGALNRTNIFGYDSMNRKIAHIMPGGQSERWACDFDGNQVVETNFDGTMNHLTNAWVNGVQILMTYDGDGDRVSKTVGTVTTYYLLDSQNPSGYSQVLEEWTNTAMAKVYNYGL